MTRVHKVLLTLITMMAIMLVAVGLNKAYQEYSSKRWREERYSRYENAQTEVEEIKVKIVELAKDEEALRNFLEENAGVLEDNSNMQEGITVVTESNDITISVSDCSLSVPSISGPGLWDHNMPHDGVSDINVSVNDLSGNDVSDNDASDNDFSGNDVSDNYVSNNDLSGNASLGHNQAEEIIERMRNGKLTLRERRKLQSSYMETIKVNQSDQEVIAQNKVDFSKMKIACLGDSITAATNLSFQENYEQYSYPAKLKELLGAEEIVNLGIGGSSIGRYWDQAFVDRYREIPADTGLIIVMGGTNDGFCVTEQDIGNLEERSRDTFVGDLDELMRGLKENYPDAVIIFATPLPNILHDILRKERENLLPQERLVDIIDQLGEEYNIPVIDLYNSNLLDSHDAANIYNFLPDGVHCNPAGYQILAEHFGAEIIKLYEEKV